MNYFQKLLDLFRRYWQNHLQGIDREDAVRRLLAGGRLSPAFVFLVVTSCSIATLGLLLNSAAVIIGAMLIAPLMGPIILLGFAIAMTNITHGIAALKALLIGVVMALMTSVIIVKLAPFIPPTSEILARTQPNIFDLLVAVIAGLVGGYAMVRREAGTVAGVAISTALMPPLASAGYGLAIADGAIFQGAIFLFLTNMVAIALSAAGIAIWYNFGNLKTPRELLWQTLAGALLLLLLSVPLVRSLNLAVTQTLTAKGVEEVLNQLGRDHVWQIGQLRIENKEGAPLRVNALVFAREIDKQAAGALEKALTQRFKRQVLVSLEQVEFGRRQEIIANPALNKNQGEPTDAEILQRYLRRLAPYPIAALELQVEQRHANVQIGHAEGITLAELARYEAALRQQFPDWSLTLIPPALPLPAIDFSPRSSSLDEVANAQLQLALWAARRWGWNAIAIKSTVSTTNLTRFDRHLDKARVQAVADALKAAGLRGEIVLGPPPFHRNTPLVAPSGRDQLVLLAPNKFWGTVGATSNHE